MCKKSPTCVWIEVWVEEWKYFQKWEEGVWLKQLNLHGQCGTCFGCTQAQPPTSCCQGLVLWTSYGSYRWVHRDKTFPLSQTRRRGIPKPCPSPLPLACPSCCWWRCSCDMGQLYPLTSILEWNGWSCGKCHQSLRGYWVHGRWQLWNGRLRGVKHLQSTTKWFEWVAEEFLWDSPGRKWIHIWDLEDPADQCDVPAPEVLWGSLWLPKRG